MKKKFCRHAAVLSITLCTVNLVWAADGGRLPISGSSVGTSSSPDVRLQAGAELGKSYVSRQAYMPDIAEQAIYYSQLWAESYRLSEANRLARERIDEKLRSGSKIAFSMILSESPMDWSKTPNDRGFVHTYRTSEAVGADSYSDLMRKVYGSPSSELRAPESTDRNRGNILYVRAGVKGEIGPDGVTRYSNVTQQDQVNYMAAEQKKRADDAQLIAKEKQEALREAEEVKRKSEGEKRKEAEKASAKAAEDAKRAKIAAEEASAKQKATESLAEKFSRQTMACAWDAESNECSKAKEDTAKSVDKVEKKKSTSLCAFSGMFDTRLSSGGAFRSGVSRRTLEVPVRLSGGFMTTQRSSIPGGGGRPFTIEDIENMAPKRQRCNPCPVCAAGANSELMNQRSERIENSLAAQQ